MLFNFIPKTHWLLLLLLFSCGETKKINTVIQQPNWKKCNELDSISKIIFSDHFDDNLNNWKFINNKHFLVKLKNGALYIEKFNEKGTDGGCLWLSKAIRGFETKDNFQISFDAHFIERNDLSNIIDFEWGDIENDLYQFSISDKGEAYLRRFSKNLSPRWIGLASNTFHNLVNTNTFNEISIKQLDNYCIICVNGIEVINTKIIPIKGNLIGIQHCWKVVWELDNLVIKQ